MENRNNLKSVSSYHGIQKIGPGGLDRIWDITKSNYFIDLMEIVVD
ncbi:MAG: hypothetical protein HOK35_09400 [Cytophagia bacterium]|nr:hypothetical protein [Cytophagia bacterium]